MDPMDSRRNLIRTNFSKIEEECQIALANIQSIKDAFARQMEEERLHSREHIINLNKQQHEVLDLLFNTNLSLEEFVMSDQNQNPQASNINFHDALRDNANKLSEINTIENLETRSSGSSLLLMRSTSSSISGTEPIFQSTPNSIRAKLSNCSTSSINQQCNALALTSPDFTQSSDEETAAMYIQSFQKSVNEYQNSNALMPAIQFNERKSLDSESPSFDLDTTLVGGTLPPRLTNEQSNPIVSVPPRLTNKQSNLTVSSYKSAIGESGTGTGDVYVEFEQNMIDCKLLEIGESPVFYEDRCYISWFVNPGEFYIQVLNENFNMLDSLMIQLYELNNKTNCPVSTKREMKNIIQKYCVAYIDGYDNAWHRAEIVDWLQDDSDLVKLSLIDYGNIMTVHFSDLRKLPKELFKLPKFARRCHFAYLYPPGSTRASNNKVWPKQIAAKLKDLLDACFRIVFIKEFRDSVGIDLINSESQNQDDTLSQILCLQNLSTMIMKDEQAIQDEIKSIRAKKQDIVTTHRLNPEASCSHFTVCLTHFNNIDEIYGRVDQFSGSVILLNNKIKSVVDSLERYTKLPKLKEIVIAKHWNNEWYRGKVINVDDTNCIPDYIVKVFFVDFGDTVDVCLKDLRKINQELLDFPFQAFVFKIPNVMPKENKLKELKEYFVKFILNHNITARLEFSQQNNQCAINLYNTSIVSKLIDLNYVDKSD